MKLRYLSFTPVLTLAVQPIQAATPSDYKCDTITDNMVEAFSALGETAPKSATAVPLQAGTLLLSADTPVLYKKYRVSAENLRQKRPLIFREYQIDGGKRFCTLTPNKKLFGKKDKKLRFRLRCLIDADGDGRFEAAIPVGKYVRHNPVTGRIVTGYQAPPVKVSLPQPVTLVEDADAPVSKPKYLSYINTHITIAEVSTPAFDTSGTETVEFLIQSAVNVTPDEEGYELVGDIERILARKFDGNEFEAKGVKIRIDQTEKGWTAQALDFAGPKAELQCGGKVIALPNSYTIVTAEQQNVVRR